MGKLGGYEFFESLNSPKFIIAPMVDQSELPWRLLSLRYGAQLCYTPMIHAKRLLEYSGCSFSSEDNDIAEAENRHESVSYRDEFFVNHSDDRPLIAQFCGNDPKWVVDAANLVIAKASVDAIDLNLGCPQGIARRGFVGFMLICDGLRVLGHYGAFLQDDWALIERVVSAMHRDLSVPVTVKIRVFPEVERTVAYAQMLERAGAQLLSVHGRTRDQKGQHTGIADWEQIKAVKESVSIPVFANGNIMYFSDVEECLARVGCDGVMVAESNLQNPALFAPSNNLCGRHRDFAQIDGFVEKLVASSLALEHPPAHLMAMEYLDICKSLDSQGQKIRISSVRSHLFKLLFHVLSEHAEMRALLVKARQLHEFIVALASIGLVVEERAMKNGNDWALLEKMHLSVRLEVEGDYRVLPYWVCQPYIRPMTALSQSMLSSSAVSCVAVEKDPRVVEARSKRKTLKLQQVKRSYKSCLSCGSVAALECGEERVWNVDFDVFVFVAHHKCRVCCRNRMASFVHGETALSTGMEKQVEPVTISNAHNWRGFLENCCTFHVTREWRALIAQNLNR